MSTTVVRTVADLRKFTSKSRRNDASLALVPTMGALHEGYLSLVRAAIARGKWVIITIFVNPRQFNDSGDHAAYPRTLDEDLAQLAPLGVHLVYAPEASEMYPRGFATTVSASGGLCGANRPGHFDGVATIVTKLLLQTGADMAFERVAAAFVLPIELWDGAEQEAFEFEPPVLALDLQPRSGPIVVKIDCTIAEQDLDTFLACMRKRRRIQSQARHATGRCSATSGTQPNGRRPIGHRHGRTIFASTIVCHRPTTNSPSDWPPFMMERMPPDRTGDRARDNTGPRPEPTDHTCLPSMRCV